MVLFKKPQQILDSFPNVYWDVDQLRGLLPATEDEILGLGIANFFQTKAAYNFHCGEFSPSNGVVDKIFKHYELVCASNALSPQAFGFTVEHGVTPDARDLIDSIAKACEDLTARIDQAADNMAGFNLSKSLFFWFVL